MPPEVKRVPTAREARLAALQEWNRTMAGNPGLFSADSLEGSSPPSVFVGSAGYPRVMAGPMVPPRFGDTSILDSPEEWAGRGLQEIVSYRLGMVRGVRRIDASRTDGKYVEGLQGLAMGDGPADAQVTFSGRVSPAELADGHSAPYGPVGSIRESSFANVSPHRGIERCHYDTDMTAAQAMVELYRSGTTISRIQRCLSVGMFGTERRLVPTKWSITAADQSISGDMIRAIREYDIIDACRLFRFSHLGNSYHIVLWPRRWAMGFAEAWYVGGVPAMGSDCEDSGGFRGYPHTAGAYFAARLAVAEYLEKHQTQAAALVLREISPDYSMPVGVWQVREGVRAALGREPAYTENVHAAVEDACRSTGVSREAWLSQRGIRHVLYQGSITDHMGP